jgi:hypothetical protein
LKNFVAAAVTLYYLPHTKSELVEILASNHRLFSFYMPLAILITFLLITSWLFSEVLVLLPLKLLHGLTPPAGLILIAVLVLFSWCFEE